MSVLRTRCLTIYVDNIEEMTKKAASLGAEIVKDITPVDDFGKFSILQDLTGAHIAFWQSLQNCT